VRCVVAVSGGIDSVVLLDTLVRAGGHELIVAHFDHGIREDSAADSRFVEALAKKYELPFVAVREELGPKVSEEIARDRRYAFLRKVARDHDATIITAHHGDDVVETVAINTMRGTGWRGLAVLNAPDVSRPLLRHTKQDIRNYALHHRLEWVEDSTNVSDDYLRNRLRRVINEKLPVANKQAIRDFRSHQLSLRKLIDNEVNSFIQENAIYSRHLFTQVDTVIGCELLRAAVKVVSGTGPTRPQTERALLAIKTARANTRHEVNGQVHIRFTARTFIVETP
jgi:tRNA(Ile)-lysidine synthetase-like protein